MRVLCDVHIPYRLINRLRQLGVDATHVNRILDGSKTKDVDIAAFVDTHQMLLITKDGDFRNSHFLNGTPKHILRLTFGNLSNTDLIVLVEKYWPSIMAHCIAEFCYLELSLEGIIHFSNEH